MCVLLVCVLVSCHLFPEAKDCFTTAGKAMHKLTGTQDCDPWQTCIGFTRFCGSVGWSKSRFIMFFPVGSRIRAALVTAILMVDCRWIPGHSFSSDAEPLPLDWTKRCQQFRLTPLSNLSRSDFGFGISWNFALQVRHIWKCRRPKTGMGSLGNTFVEMKNRPSGCSKTHCRCISPCWCAGLGPQQLNSTTVV